MTERLPDFLSLEAILIHQEDKGESYKYISLLCEQYGLIRCLWRKKKKGTVNYQHPDYLDFGNWELTQSKDGKLWYLKDFESNKLFSSISQNYNGFAASAIWCRFLNKNLIHTEWIPDIYALNIHGLKGWISGYDSNVVLLKCFYVFCRLEGLPVKEAWLQKLHSEYSDAAKEYLFSPLKESYRESPTKTLLNLLRKWIREHTDLIIDTDAD